MSPTMLRSVASGLMMESVRSMATMVPWSSTELRGLIATAHESGKAGASTNKEDDPENKTAGVDLDRRVSGHLLPASLLSLLPIAHGVAFGFGCLHFGPSTGNSLLIAPVKDIGDAGVGRGIGEHRAVDQEADLCRIGIVLAGGQINGMSRSMPVARRSVRQETLLAIGPQQRIERLPPLLARALHGCAPAALERHLEQRGQDLFESAA